MAIKLLLVCLGICLLGKQADAQAALSATAISVAENVASTVGSVGATGTPVSVSITSEPNDGQLTVAVSGGNSIDFTLTSGFVLDYEIETSLVVVVQMVDGTPATSSGTVTITVTDVVEEFTSQAITVCLTGTSYAAASVLTTQIASLSTVTAAYTLSSQTPNVGHLSMSSSTGAISVAAGKTLNAQVAPVYTATISLTSSAPSVTTSTAVVTFSFGCSSGAATLMVGTFTLLLAMLVALLQ